MSEISNHQQLEWFFAVEKILYRLYLGSKLSYKADLLKDHLYSPIVTTVSSKANINNFIDKIHRVCRY